MSIYLNRMHTIYVFIIYSEIQNKWPTTIPRKNWEENPIKTNEKGPAFLFIHICILFISLLQVSQLIVDKDRK